LFVVVTIFLVISTIVIIPVQALKTRSKSYICIDDDCFSGGNLIVIVKNADGTYAEGVSVKLYKLNTGLMSRLMESGTTGEDGRFVVTLPRGIYYAIVEKDGLEKRSNNFYLGLFKTVFITLPGEPSFYEVTIHVQYSNGDPIVTTVIVENSVGVEMGQGYTDGSGNYKICLVAGDYSATAEDPLGGPSKTEYFTVLNELEVIITIIKD